MQLALNIVTNWTVKKGLDISTHKVVVVPFTRRRNHEGLTSLKLHDEINMPREGEYLGVNLDFKLTWNKKLNKTQNIYIWDVPRQT